MNQSENNKIQGRDIVKEMQESYIDYAMSVIVSRALPDVRDGLKPVQRRILYAMYEMGLRAEGRFRKSATVVGECFVKGTMVLTKKGLLPIQDIRTGDQVFTTDGLRKVRRLYEMPARPLLKVTLGNGLSNIVTPSQKFKVLTPDWKFVWKEAKDLTKNDYIVIKTAYPKINNLVELNVAEENQLSYLNENIAYLLGFFVSDGSISDDYGRKKLPRICFESTNQIVIKKIKTILEKEFGYKATIELRPYIYRNSKGVIFHNNKYRLRINRNKINDFFVSNFGLRGQKAPTKQIPLQIFRSPPLVIFSFISGLIDGDGYVSKKKNYIQYGSVSEKLIDQLMILLQHQGVFSSKYKRKIPTDHAINGIMVKGRRKPYSLEIYGKDCADLAKLLNPASKEKLRRLKRIAEVSATTRGGWSNFEIIPYASELLFKELSRNHLGGGWYQDGQGKKFRAGIKHPSGCKIRYSSDLLETPLRKTQIIDWGIKEKLERIDSSLSGFVENIIKNEISFSRIASVEKAAPQETYDFEVEGAHEFIANGMVSHNCMGKFHPHGDAAIYDALARMTQDFTLRYPLVEGQGNWGCFTKDTKVRLTDGRSLSFDELIKEQKKDKRHWTFAFDHQNKKIEITEIKNPRLTRKKERIMEITLDNGEKIKCTLDHRFMLRDGSYKGARDLESGDSLMPLYNKPYDGESNLNLKGYEMIWQPIKDKWELTHHLSDKWNLKKGIKERHNNCFPKLESAQNYFDDFSEMVGQAQRHNHKVVKTRILQKREDVYDLTTEPWHNFLLAAGVFVHNSIDDPSEIAAMRYTEAKLSKIGQETLKDIEKNTVGFVDNYDATRKEPQVLPSPLPQLLLNGCLGIAVGMATSIPPHNLSEIVAASCYLIDNPEATTKDLFRFVEGPDFPGGGIVFDKEGLVTTYSQGKGPIVIRGKADIEKTKRKLQIIITEIPFMVRKSDLIQELANLVKDKKLEGVSDIRDESDKEGLRIVLDLSQRGFPKKILNRLYKFTRLQNTFYLNAIALADGIQPRVLSLKEILRLFVEHRQEVVRRRTSFDLKRAEERAHILKGLEKALQNIDAVISTIKKSASAKDAEENLVKKFKLTKIQAQAILTMRLASLARLERERVKEELDEKEKEIKELSAILKSIKKIKELVKKELIEMKESYGDARRTKILSQELKEIPEKDLIPHKETIITLTQGGYIKRIPPRILRRQKRGGKGVLGMETVGEDVVTHFLLAKTLDSLLFFTDSGRVFKTLAYEMPQQKRVAKGKKIDSLLALSQTEKVLSLIPLRREYKELGINFLVMATKNGIIKKTPLEDFKNVRKTGLIAIKLKGKDALESVRESSGNDHIMLVTKNGLAIRFKEEDVRPMGRPAAGLKGIGLRRGDEVVGMEVIRSSKLKTESLKQKKEYMLVVTENGYGKRTDLKEYKVQKRGGVGLKTAQVTKKTGKIVVAKVLTDQNDLVVISQKGKVIRTKVSSISVFGRSTQGVRIMKLEKGDRVASIAVI